MLTRWLLLLKSHSFKSVFLCEISEPLKGLCLFQDWSSLPSSYGSLAMYSVISDNSHTRIFPILRPGGKPGKLWIAWWTDCVDGRLARRQTSVVRKSRWGCKASGSLLRFQSSKTEVSFSMLIFNTLKKTAHCCAEPSPKKGLGRLLQFVLIALKMESLRLRPIVAKHTAGWLTLCVYAQHQQWYFTK